MRVGRRSQGRLSRRAGHKSVTTRSGFWCLNRFPSSAIPTGRSSACNRCL